MRILLLPSLLLLSACGGPGSENSSSRGVADPLASCAACHSLTADGPRRSGPTLAGVIGRPAGTVAGYRYSAAMASSRIVWTEKAMDEFLKDPRAVIPGTRMVQQVRDDAQRRDIVAALAKN